MRAPGENVTVDDLGGIRFVRAVTHGGTRTARASGPSSARASAHDPAAVDRPRADAASSPAARELRGPPVTWGALVIAVPAGALVGIGSGLLVVIVWKWQPVRAQ